MNWLRSMLSSSGRRRRINRCQECCDSLGARGRQLHLFAAGETFLIIGRDGGALLPEQISLLQLGHSHRRQQVGQVHLVSRVLHFVDTRSRLLEYRFQASPPDAVQPHQGFARSAYLSLSVTNIPPSPVVMVLVV